LVALHQRYGKALYERNIRYFLGSAKSDVNKSIKTTLLDTPADFFYLNNGVTAVCDLIDPKSNKGGFKKFKVRGLSIINGAQTVASAAEFVRQYPSRNIDDAKVMFTLIQAPADGVFGQRVTKARNHQNPVQSTNFTSLDQNQERLRQEIAHLGFTYYYRPEVAVTGVDAITLDEALKALALLNSDPRYTVWLKTEATRLATVDSAEYQSLFSEQLSGVVLVNAVHCHRAIRSLVMDYEQRAPLRCQERLVYRHGGNVISSVMLKRLRKRINATHVIEPDGLLQLISAELDALRETSAELFSRHATNGPLSFFRNQTDVIPYMAEVLEIHFNLSADPVVQELRARYREDKDGYPRKRLIDNLVSRAPQL
jgi:hypothetical protein